MTGDGTISAWTDAILGVSAASVVVSSSDNVCPVAEFHDVTRTNCDDKKRRLNEKRNNMFVRVDVRLLKLVMLL